MFWKLRHDNVSRRTSSGNESTRVFVCFYYFLEITSHLQEKKYKEYLCTLYPDLPAVKI